MRALPLLVILAGLACVGPPVHALDRPLPSTSAALAYLDARYNPALGLLNETAYGDGAHQYWINDNLFALEALERAGRPSDQDRARQLSATLRALAQDLRLGAYEDGTPRLGLHEVIRGHATVRPQPCPNHYSLPEDNAVLGLSWAPPTPPDRLRFTVWNETRPRDGAWVLNCYVEEFNGYADYLLYDALSAASAGNRSLAQSRFNETLRLWDGVGLADNSFTIPGDPQYQKYATYKIALLLYVGSELGFEVPMRAGILETLGRMQAFNGGFVTNYGRTGTPRGDANTETTALAVLALGAPAPAPATSTPSPPPPSRPSLTQVLVALVVALLVTQFLTLVRLERLAPGRRRR